MRSSDFILYKNASEWIYAASIAATWVWAPALFVSSSKAYYAGIDGFLWFLIPNILTLVLFGWFASKVKNTNFVSVFDVVKTASTSQAYVHEIVSIMLLLGSTVVQLVGIHTLIVEWMEVPKIVSLLLVSGICLALVWRNGLKSCISTDLVKYVILLVSGVVLAGISVYSGEFHGWQGLNDTSVIYEAATFGVITAIGLFSAPYVDQTFWQRSFSIGSDKVLPVFCKAALLFGIIPLLFGLVGFFSTGNATWAISSNFDGVPAVVLLVGVLCALISTLDSNLCAISSFAWKASSVNNVRNARLAMLALIVVAGLIFLVTNFTITQWFLLYGTVRTCVAIPTVLIILDKYDANRLFGSTLVSVVCAPVGYALTVGTGFEWIFTVSGFLLPILGYKPKEVLTN